MRDQYAGDISDYLKFSFLRSALPKESRLGVAWYFLPGHDGRADGRHEEYLQQQAWRGLDPDLFDLLGRRSHRSVAELEKIGVLPRSTLFHRVPVPGRRERVSWHEDMIRSLALCDVVFADPDNGVSRPGVVSRKSAVVDEVRDLCKEGRTAFLIRFPHRLTSHDDQLADQHRTFAEYAPLTLRTCVRVPNGNGTTSPRIRWFSALNPRTETRGAIADFAARLQAVPGATVRVEG